MTRCFCYKSSEHFENSICLKNLPDPVLQLTTTAASYNDRLHRKNKNKNKKASMWHNTGGFRSPDPRPEMQRGPKRAAWE
jgi:hypothetical protein